MDSRKLHLSLSSFLLLFSFSSSTLTVNSSHSTLNQLNPFEDILCSFINCGQGTCKASNTSLLGFDCECNSGWRKIQIGPLTFPSCLIPNCTVEFDCGNESPSAPPPPISLPPSENQTNHCDLIWCGDGKCVTNGTGHICHCNQGSENLFHSSDFACFKPCYFGVDCQNLGFDLPPTRPKQPPPPPPNCLSSNGIGSKGVRCWSGTLRRLSAIVAVAACSLTWL